MKEIYRRIDKIAHTDISVLMSAKRDSREFAHEKETKAPEGAVTGAVTGGAVGGVLGWLLGIGALSIPGLGPFIAAGPIMAALSGTAVGAAAGGITGALIGMGIPEYEAKRYEHNVKEGKVLVSVHADDAEEVLVVECDLSKIEETRQNWPFLRDRRIDA